MSVQKYNEGKWTRARFLGYIKSGLRSLSQKWPPKHEVKKAARVERGRYKCAGYRKRWHIVPASTKINGKRVNNVHVDHINPVIDPKEGFVSWDKVIERMFCEAEGLQVLCYDCHKRKTHDERKSKSNG